MQSPKLVKKVLQTALVWTLYEDLVPRLSAMGQEAQAAWSSSRGSLDKSGGK